MNNLKVIFSQILDPCKLDHPIEVERKAVTDDKKSEQFLRLWASHELFKWYKLAQSFNLRTFHLRLKIKVDVYWDNKLENSYVQKRFTKDLIFDEKTEYKIGLRNGFYVLKPFIDNYQPQVKARQLINNKVETNFLPLLNSIEYRQIEKVKFATPILYTGMTN